MGGGGGAKGVAGWGGMQPAARQVVCKGVRGVEGTTTVGNLGRNVQGGKNCVSREAAGSGRRPSPNVCVRGNGEMPVE